MKLAIPVITGTCLLLVTLSLLSATVAAQANQVTASVSLNYLNIQVTYPSEVSPGDTVTAHVDANAKSSFYLVALTAQVFYADGNNIHQLVTKTLASNSQISAGKSLSGDIQITVPQDAPRTSLAAAFSERTQQNYYDYSSYYPYATAYYMNYSSPYYAYYCDPYYANSMYCPYQYYSQYYPYSYYTVYYGYPSSSSYTTTTDVGITSLPYIKATTPEATALQAQNQQLQQQLNQSQADNQKLQSDNQKLQQNLQNAQQTIVQQDSAANDMNQRLTSSKYITYGLGALAAVFAILAVHFRRQRGRPSFPQQAAQYGQTGTPGEQQPPTPSKEQLT